MAELLEMSLRMWTGVGPRNHVLDGGPYNPHCEWAILRAKRGRARTCSTVDILKATQQGCMMRMPIGGVLGGVHIVAIW